MILVHTKKLGLAAYIIMKGGVVQNFHKKTFSINTNKSLEEWEIEYRESCCSSHDKLVCDLRNKYLVNKSCM